MSCHLPGEPFHEFPGLCSRAYLLKASLEEALQFFLSCLQLQQGQVHFHGEGLMKPLKEGLHFVCCQISGLKIEDPANV